MATLDRIATICGAALDERELRVQVLAQLRTAVPCDAYAWLLTDPETCVGSAPLAETPSLADLPALIRLKYLTRVNRWTSLPPNTARTLVDATDSDRSRSPMWQGLLRTYEIDDVVSVAFADQYGCWGFLDLWRRAGAFTSNECTLIERVVSLVTPALRSSLATSFALPAAAIEAPAEPVVMMLSGGLQMRGQTLNTDAYLRALLPTEASRAPVPAAAFNVAAQLLAVEAGVDAHPPAARVRLRDGLWVTLRAARIESAITVTIEPTPPSERTALYARVVGLTERETDLLQHLTAGADTRELAAQLFVSEHTVQDHLKSIFAKTATNNRRVLVARATGTA
jgi:DNA-binding CsgD family transcriptional regulator